MRAESKIARRYLFRRGGGVVSRITRLSIAGMALGTAAMLIVLSVYNGFDGIIRRQISGPDYVISPRTGKFFSVSQDEISKLEALEGVVLVEKKVEDKVAVTYSGKQAVTKVRGLDGVWQCSVSAPLAAELGIRTHFLSPLTLYYPSRSESFSLSRPEAALESISMRPKEVLSSNENFVTVPIEQAQTLFHLDSTQVSGIDIYGDGVSKRSISAVAGPDFRVLDSYEQNSALFKMMRYEKSAIFLILFFIVILIAFNIFGAQRMLLTEKKEDIAILCAMGAGRAQIRKIFFLEGWGISLAGMGIGVVAAVAVVLLQQFTGFVKMPGNYVVQAYPVMLQWQDIVLCCLLIALIGALISLLSYDRRSRQNADC